MRAGWSAPERAGQPHWTAVAPPRCPEPQAACPNRPPTRWFHVDQQGCRPLDTETQQPGPGLYTLTDAAALTGLSVEAIRLRVKRGRLASERGNDGRPRVRLTTADLEALRQQRPTVGEQGAALAEQEATDRGQAETALALLDLVDRALARADAVQAAAAEARERAARAEGEVAGLRDALARSEARATAAEREAGRLRGRGWWARLRNLP